VPAYEVALKRVPSPLARVRSPQESPPLALHVLEAGAEQDAERSVEPGRERHDR
jgi:hypothetical protein